MNNKNDQIKKFMAGLLTVTLTMTAAPLTTYAEPAMPDTSGQIENTSTTEELSDHPDEILPYADAVSPDVLLPDETVSSDVLPSDDAVSSDALLPDETLSSDTLLSDDAVFSDALLFGEMPEEHPVEVENPSFVRKGYSTDSIVFDDLPASYIAPYLPPLRSQSPYGTCWAFSSMALGEMNLITNGDISPDNLDKLDLSELQLAYFSYNTVTDPLGGTYGDRNEMIPDSSADNFLKRGGNRNYAKNILASWTGAVSETDAPYTESGMADALENGLDEELAYNSDVAHMTDYYDVQLSTTDTTKNTKVFNEEGIKAAKQLIYSHGAIGLSFYALSSGSSQTSNSVYNSEHNSYYDSRIRATNHAITVVGWDDNFKKGYFTNGTNIPEKDGAWLVRNSWQEGGDYEHNQKYAGYFWLSYYSKSNGDSANAFLFNSTDNYDNNYQYDGSMSSTSWYSGKNYHVKLSNVFNTPDDGSADLLKAVSFATPSSEVDYEITIYTGIEKGGDPSTGILAEGATTRGSTSFSGYHTITLSEPVPLDPDTGFAVVVELYKNGSWPRFYIESSVTTSNWFRTSAAIQKGQSYYFSYSENKWLDYYDLSTRYANGNFRIKAFTDNAGSHIIPDTGIKTHPVVINGLKYTGYPQTLIIPGTALDGFTLKYRIGSIGNYSESLPAGTQAGEYVVYYKAFGNSPETYDGEEHLIKITIDRADPSYTAEPAPVPDLLYNGGLQDLITGGITEDGEIKYRLSTNEVYSREIPSASDAGPYDVYYRIFGNRNHNDGEERHVQVSINFMDPPSVILYDGAEKKDSYGNSVIISAPGYGVSDSSDGDYTDSYTITGLGNVTKTLYFMDLSGHISDGVDVSVNLKKVAEPVSCTYPVPGDVSRTYGYDLSCMLPEELSGSITSYNIENVTDENGILGSSPTLEFPGGKNLIFSTTGNNSEGEEAKVLISFKNVYYHIPDAVLTIRISGPETYSVQFIDGEISDGINIYKYTGSAIKPHMNVTYNGRTLIEGTDYSVSYANNVSAYIPVSVNSAEKKSPRVTVKFKGDYTGKETLNFGIECLSYDYLSENALIVANPLTANVKKAANGKYTKQKLKPVVYYEGKKLRLNTDYTLEYPDNSNDAYAGPGKWEIKVNAKGSNFMDYFTVYEYLYEGTPGAACIPLNARGMKIASNATSVEFRNEPYEVKNFWPEYSVSYKDPSTGEIRNLSRDTDYTVDVINGDKTGTATAVITAIPGSGFVGSITKSFRITRADLTDRISASFNSIEYEKGGVKPRPVNERVIYMDGGFEIPLVEGRDYRLVYGSNNTVRDASAKYSPYVQIRGIGNYKGTATTRFSILQKDIGTLSSNNLVVGDVAYSKSKNAYKKTAVVIYDTNGKLLDQGRDYYISKCETTSGKTVPDEGETVQITITGKNNYKGDISTEYKILKNSIAKTNIRFYNSEADKISGRKTTEFAYTGYEIEPKFTDLFFGSGKNEQKLIEGTQYMIAGCCNNIDKGTGYIVIKGMGEYAGVKVFRFRITAKKIAR